MIFYRSYLNNSGEIRHPARHIRSIDAPLRLPAVGIPLLRQAQLDSQSSMKLNPFVIPKNTELMLINNERQRIQEQLTREKIKNVFKIHEKGTSNFRNRQGIIREIDSIKPIEEHEGYARSVALKKMAKRYSAAGHADSDKINIFEGDPREIDEKLKLIERQSQLSVQTKSVTPQEIRTVDVHTTKAKWNSNVKYLKQMLENKELRKDFVANSRELLFKEISIRNKREETEKLKEFIDTENEKLAEAKNSFKEDSDKFQKFVEDLTLRAEQAKHETETLVDEKQQKSKVINALRDQLSDVVREIGKIDDELSVAYDHRDFIMYLAHQLPAVEDDVKTEQQPQEKEEENEIFMTEYKKNMMSDGPPLDDEPTLPMNKQTLLNMIVMLEEKVCLQNE